MSDKLIKTIDDMSMEVDYGMQYMMKSLHNGQSFNSEYLSIAYSKMFECRELLISWLDFTDDFRRYADSDDPSNDYVEPRDAVVDPEFVNVEKGKEKHIHLKYLRKGTSEISKKLIDLVLEHNSVENVHLLQASSVSLEKAYIWLREELLLLKNKYPKTHSTQPTKESRVVSKVDEIIENRTKKED